MLKDLIEYIFNEARASHNPSPIVTNLDGRKQLITLKGSMTERLRDPSPMTRKVETVQSFCDACSHFAGDKPTVYVSLEEVSCILDNADRREAVYLTIEDSPQARDFRRLANGVTQRELIKILRTSLHGCIHHQGFLDICRVLQFNIEAGATGSVQHGRDSFGSSVEKEVRSKAGDLPEETSITFRAYSQPMDLPSQISFPVSIDLDADNQTISLNPIKDGLQDQLRALRGELVEALRNELPEEFLVVTGHCAC